MTAAHPLHVYSHHRSSPPSGRKEQWVGDAVVARYTLMIDRWITTLSIPRRGISFATKVSSSGTQRIRYNPIEIQTIIANVNAEIRTNRTNRANRSNGINIINYI